MAESLTEDLREQIGSTGPLPFVKFMQLALYHPRHGYYATRVPGHGGNYRTSPSLTSWFGRLVGRQLHRMWEGLGRPDPFWVVEVGAGRGDLAAGAMEAAGPLTAALRWRFIERFDRVRTWQRQRLGDAAGVEWSSDLAELSSMTGCILANEVLDNFPVHLLEVVASGDAREVYVDVERERFVERLGPLSDAALVEPARHAAGQLTTGIRFEIAPEFESWLGEASRVLERGYLLLIDYGDVEPSVWLDKPQGTLATYRDSDLGPSALEDPGRKDITADVNFSAVSRAARAAGFSGELLVTQRDWLLSLGLPQIAEELELAGFQAALEGLVEEAALLEDELRRLLDLGKIGGLGDLLVFRAAKGAEPPWRHEVDARDRSS